MSSACVCHTSEFCFYCEMYVPLERKYQTQTAAIEECINKFGSAESYARVGLGSVRGLGMAHAYKVVVNQLKEVLARETNNQHRSDGRGPDDAER